MNNRATGSNRERQAEEYLEKQGMRIVERNFRCKLGEIDLIGWHQNYLVFVEVKYRSSKVKGSAVEAVDGRKQKRICRVADYYRKSHRIGVQTGIRYDVVAIQGENIEWIPNAFPHIFR